MSCFRLPKTITSKISAAIANFWWHNSGTSSGIHWTKWEYLCKSKNEGGLGFRAIEEFNSALLAKQLWRLVTKPNSLLSRVLKGRYFSTCSPLDPKRIYAPSYGWRSIVSARALLSKGLIRRIGNGDSIRVWYDPWIPDENLRPARGLDPSLYPLLKVSDLIDSRTRLWKEPLVRQFFTQQDANIILGIHIPRSPTMDSFGWHYTKSGAYTVRSGYWVERNIAQYSSPVYGPNILDLKNKVWKLRIPQKLKHFLWQALSGHLAVKSNLLHRGIQCDTRCDRCGLEGETIAHVLFDCDPARQVWALSNIPNNHFFPSTSLFSNFDHLFSRLPVQVSSDGFPWILWHLWKARNEKYFRNKDTDPREIIRQAEADAEVWNIANKVCEEEKVGSLMLPDLTAAVISRPITALSSFTGFRCMVDASWKDSDLFTGIAWYAYSFGGEGINLGAQCIRRSLSPLHAEFEALLWAMTIMEGLQLLEVEFLVDCVDLVKMVEDPDAWPAFLPYLEDFSRLRSTFRSCSLYHIPRAINYKADHLARSVRVVSSNHAFVNNIPTSWAL